eukprot:530907_1
MGCVSSTKRPINSLILHFSGINTNKLPKKCKSTFKLFESPPIITIQTSLNTNDTILKLKKFIKKIYSIPSKHDLLILYSHHIISNDDRLTLSDYGITNRSLLLLAIQAPNNPKRIPSFISQTYTFTSDDDLYELDRIHHHVHEHVHEQVVFDNLYELDRIDRIRPRHQPRLMTISLQEDIDNDTFVSSRTYTSSILESISNNAVFHHRIDRNRYNINNSLPNIFEGNNENECDEDIDIETSYTTSCTPTFEPEERAEEKAAILNYNIYSEETKRAELYHSNDTIISTIDSEYTTTLDNDTEESFEIKIDTMESPHTNRIPFQRKTKLIGQPIRTTNYNTSVPITRIHYNNESENNIFEEHKMPNMPLNISNNTITATNDIILSPTISTTWSKSVDIEPENQFKLNGYDMNDSDIEDINEYKTSLKLLKGFDIIMQESDVNVYRMPNCKHVMNKESLYYYALNTFTDKNNIYLTCPHASEEIKCNANEWSCMHCTFINDISNNSCEMCQNIKGNIEKKQLCATKWNYSLIKQILYSDNLDTDDHQNNIKLVKLELLSARNKIQKHCNVQKCPKCNSLYFKDEYNIKHQHDFKTKCICCDNNNYFCFGCGQLWGNDTHACDTSFRTELIKILNNVSTKKIGDVDNVPCMRACPNCAQIITHTDACKHMCCKSCKKDFCFVCLKMKKNGNWKCGSSSSRCDIHPIQNEKTLPNAVLINKKAFTLF